MLISHIHQILSNVAQKTFVKKWKTNAEQRMVFQVTKVEFKSMDLLWKALFLYFFKWIHNGIIQTIALYIIYYSITVDITISTYVMLFIKLNFLIR